MSAGADQPLLVEREGGQLCIRIQPDYLNPTGVEYCLKMVMLSGSTPQFGRHDVWNDHLAIAENRFEDT